MAAWLSMVFPVYKVKHSVNSTNELEPVNKSFLPYRNLSKELGMLTLLSLTEDRTHIASRKTTHSNC